MFTITNLTWPAWVNDGRPHHFAAISDGESLAVYFDGKRVQ